MATMFAGIAAQCTCVNDGACLCTRAERVVRAYAAGHSMPAMSIEQREWCLRQIDTSGEGQYDLAACRKMSDRDLAETVLDSWRVYATSQGLY